MEETFAHENQAGNHYDGENDDYPAWEDEDDNYVFLAEGDLDEVMDEQDVLQALASYHDTRQALKDQRLSRGYFPGKGKGKVDGFQKGKNKGKRKVHIEQLKLRTRCRRCLQVGHWERECQNPAASQAAKAESRTFFVGLHPESPEFSTAQQDFWLRQFVKENRARQGVPMNLKPAANSSEIYMKRACMVKEGKVNFCGITTEAIEGVVDTAAEGGLIGKEPLLRLERELAARGLRVKWVPKRSFAKGVGGNAVVEGVALIPVGLGGINGVLETTVVQGDVPLLLPIKLLKALGAIIDLNDMVLHFPGHRISLSLRELTSGHVTVNVMSFTEGKFIVPPEAGSQSEFELESSCFVTSAMQAQSDCSAFQFDRLPKDASSSPQPHGVAPSESKGIGGRNTFHGPGADGSRASSVELQGSTQELARRAGQDRHPSGLGSTTGHHRGLVFGLGLAAAGAQIYGQHRGLLLGGDHQCTGAEAPAEQSWSHYFRECMRAPQSTAERWGQRLEFLHRVPSVPHQVGPFRAVRRHPEEDQGRPLERDLQGGGPYIPEGFGYKFDSAENADKERRPDDRRTPDSHPILRGRIFDVDEAGPPDAAGHSCSDHDAAASKRAGRDHDPPVATQCRPATTDLGGGEENGSGQSRARSSAGEAHADAHQRPEPGGLAGSEGKLQEVSTAQSPQGVQVRQTCGGIGGQERGTSQRPHVLEMCPAEVRHVRVDCGGGPGGHRRGEDGGIITESTEVQEPEEGGLGGSSYGGHGIAGDELGPSVSAQQPGGECAGGGCGGVRWVKCCTQGANRWARRAQRGKDPFFEVYGTFWKMTVDGGWQEEHGEIPKESAEIYVQVRASRRGDFQDQWEDARTTHLTRKNRQFWTKAIKKTEETFKKTIAELYSPPRVASTMNRKGYDTGTSFDLATGWDLSCPSDRKAMWKALREESPMVIVACPLCTAFSRMQAVNWGRMTQAKKVHLLKTGKEHLHLAIAVMKWQLRRGGAILFEHPEGATSWQDPQLQSLAAQRDVKTVVCDQCMFGLNVDGQGLNRKRTRWLSNMPPVLEALNVKCDRTHFHVPLENGRPKLAQVYPERLCQAVARGIIEYLNGKDIYAHELEDGGEDEEEEEVDDGPDPGADEGPGNYEPTEEEKKSIMKVHRAVGHPQQREFIRFLRAARVRGELVQWASKGFRCDICEAKRHPKAPRPTAIPRAYQPNRVLGLDLFYVPAPGDGKQTTPVLNILDWGTNYQMCEVLAGKHPGEVWEAYQSTWARTFGHPEVITCDAGREFLGEFIQRAANEGIVVHQIASKAPWQQGKTERHGGHFKELLDKARSEVVIQTTKDLKQLMTEVEQAKNRYSNRSGFAPVQRQIGQWPRLPTSVLSDEAIDPTLLNGVLTDDIEKLHHMRNIAHKAFCEHNAKRTLQRAMKARPRVWIDYKPGEYVFVFRVPKLKKRKRGGIADDTATSTKARWVGPGVVIAPDGANVWISMFGELWKVAREQCRHATTDEKTGIEAVLQECQELIEEFKRGSHRTGYKDITQEDLPPEEGEGEGDEQDQRVQDPRTNFLQPSEVIEYTPELMDEDDEPPGDEEVVPKRRKSVNEPEQEEVPSSKASSDAGIKEARHHPGFPEGVPETPARPSTLTGGNRLEHRAEATSMQGALRLSEQQANRLDGVPGPLTGPIYRWQQRQGQHAHIAPYLGTSEWFLAEDAEIDEETNLGRMQKLQALEQRRAERDYWHIDWEAGTMERHHLRKRKTKFSPEHGPEGPLPSSFLSTDRQTHVRRAGTTTIESDSWINPQNQWREELWRGKTIFYIKNIEEAKVYATEKKGQDDVILSRESPQDREEWKLSDLSEWNKVTQSGAVEVLGLEESQRIRQELRDQGQEARILPTKIARRYKPGEQPGEPAVKKSRLCIRGDLDPDILELDRFSPTLNTVNFNVLLQVAANENMVATVGDLKNAFCQSQPLHRPNGQLYFQQPREGVVGLHPEQIVKIIAGCYGLVDAPLHWRKSLIEDLQKLGYEMSALDPCIMKLYDKSRKRLLGAIAVEVDDLFTVGHEEHHAKMDELRAKYTFGKYVHLQQTKDGCAFNGRRVRQLPDGGFLVDMQKFIEERLHPVQLEKGRKVDKKATANDQEISAARATCGALNWLSREGRPDASGASSLVASKLAKLTIEDITQLNQVVAGLKEHSSLSLKIQPLKRMRLSVVTDASFANNGFHSQGGHLVLAHENQLRDGNAVTTNILAWRSGKLQRIVNSTLAAETQSMSRGLAELMWIHVLVQEMMDGTFALKAWRKKLEGEELMVMSSTLNDHQLKESLAVVDAKSLYDNLSKDSTGGQDRRTAIEVQIIRQDLKELGGEVKWVDHLAMPADSLTKVLGSNAALYELIGSGRFSIRPTDEQMARRAQARKDGQTSSDLRRFGIKEKPWNCSSEEADATVVDSNLSVVCRPNHQGP